MSVLHLNRRLVTEEVALEAVRKDAGVLYDIPPVSYTHLDVYKRQLLYRVFHLPLRQGSRGTDADTAYRAAGAGIKRCV